MMFKRSEGAAPIKGSFGMGQNQENNPLVANDANPFMQSLQCIGAVLQAMRRKQKDEFVGASRHRSGIRNNVEFAPRLKFIQEDCVPRIAIRLLPRSDLDPVPLAVTIDQMLSKSPSMAPVHSFQTTGRTTDQIHK